MATRPIPPGTVNLAINMPRQFRLDVGKLAHIEGKSTRCSARSADSGSTRPRLPNANAGGLGSTNPSTNVCGSCVAAMRSPPLRHDRSLHPNHDAALHRRTLASSPRKQFEQRRGKQTRDKQTAG